MDFIDFTNCTDNTYTNLKDFTKFIDLRDFIHLQIL